MTHEHVYVFLNEALVRNLLALFPEKNHCTCTQFSALSTKAQRLPFASKLPLDGLWMGLLRAGGGAARGWGVRTSIRLCISKNNSRVCLCHGRYISATKERPHILVD